MSATNKTNCGQKALKLLAAKALSESELRGGLAAEQYNNKDIELVINDCKKRGYLNDFRLCQSLYENYSSTGKYGLNWIITRLKKRGFTQDVINAAVADYSQDCGFEQAVKMVNKRYNNVKPEDMPKIGRFLANRGFTFNIIKKVLMQFDIYS